MSAKRHSIREKQKQSDRRRQREEKKESAGPPQPAKAKHPEPKNEYVQIVLDENDPLPPPPPGDDSVNPVIITSPKPSPMQHTPIQATPTFIPVKPEIRKPDVVTKQTLVPPNSDFAKKPTLMPLVIRPPTKPSSDEDKSDSGSTDRGAKKDSAKDGVILHGPPKKRHQGKDQSTKSIKKKRGTKKGMRKSSTTKSN